jgi:hypothetical protein
MYEVRSIPALQTVGGSARLVKLYSLICEQAVGSKY